MLTHTHPPKPPRKIKVTICSQQADSPLYAWSDVWSGDLQVQKSLVIHDTECPYWNQVIKQYKPSPYTILTLFSIVPTICYQSIV